MAIKTFSIDEEVYQKFAEFCKTHGINMSKQVEVFMKSQLETKEKVREEYLQTLDKLRKGRFIKVKEIDDIL